MPSCSTTCSWMCVGLSSSVCRLAEYTQANACVLNAIVCDDCRIGQWARVEGSPAEGSTSKQNITILGALAFSIGRVAFLRGSAGKEVTVAREIFVRSCIVLPHKGLSKSSANEVLL